MKYVLAGSTVPEALCDQAFRISKGAIMLRRQRSQFRGGFGAQTAQLLRRRYSSRVFKAGLGIGVFAALPKQLAERNLNPDRSYHHVGALNIRESFAENALSLCGPPCRNQRAGSS